MSDDARTLEPVKFPRYERRGFFLGLKWYQLLIVAGGGAVAVVASASGGKPPGRERFEKETGIRVADWYPHLWLRWGEALIEAGFAPNRLSQKMDNTFVLDKYTSLRTTWISL